MWRYNSTPVYELYHHGVKGQKWGVRNGPPYPIKRSENSVEKSSTNSTIIKDAIASGAVSAKLNVEKQKRHTKSDHLEGRGYLDGDLDFAEELIKNLSGTGEPVMDRHGEWTHKERVTNPEEIGTYPEKDGTESRSNLGMIVYSKTGAHIYPRKRGTNES